jgi:pimeloyl-ACP methyl ester carboxylesterase
VAESKELRPYSVAVAGVHSPVLESGPADTSEAVVFVHGNPGAGRDWEDLLRRVGPVARAIAPDMPGYGDADKPRGFDYTVTGYAQHLAGILDQHGVRRAHLVLHDFGGPWGLAWGLAHPDSFASVTLINTGALIGYRWHRYARIWRTPVVGELFMLMSNRWALRAVLKRENPGLSSRHLDQLYQQSRHPATKRAVLKLYRATPPTASKRSIRRCARWIDRPWSSGARGTATSRSSKPSCSGDPSPTPESRSSRAPGTGSVGKSQRGWPHSCCPSSKSGSATSQSQKALERIRPRVGWLAGCDVGRPQPQQLKASVPETRQISRRVAWDR